MIPPRPAPLRRAIARAALAASTILALVAASPAAPQAASNPPRADSLANPGSSFGTGVAKGNWHAVIARTERGHLIGNPEADARLIEFVSYTCGHCANFARDGDTALDLVLLRPGKLSVEVRPVIRNALDLTVTLLVQCGDAAGFKERHHAFMSSQEAWMAKLAAAPQSQQAVWARGDKAARVNAASALGLAAKLIERGASAAAVNSCLTDDAAARTLMANGTADQRDFAFPGTPSFALDGKLLTEVHEWRTLEPVLAARFARR